jgi:hypothetical protein
LPADIGTDAHLCWNGQRTRDIDVVRSRKSLKSNGSSEKRPSTRLLRLGSEAPLVPADEDHGNRQRLADILQGHYPDDTPLHAIGFHDQAAKIVLAALIRREAVAVDVAGILRCRVVGHVLDEMNRVSAAG